MSDTCQPRTGEVRRRTPLHSARLVMGSTHVLRVCVVYLVPARSGVRVRSRAACVFVGLGGRVTLTLRVG